MSLSDENYKIGQEIFEKIFKLSEQEIVFLVCDILNDEHCSSLKSKYNCIRTIKNDVPEKITFKFYDSIEISWLGIYFIPEIGPSKRLRKFDKYFKI